MPWALTELSIEIDAVTALLSVRALLDDQSQWQQVTEAQILSRAIRQLVGRASRIDWSVLGDLLDSLDNHLKSRARRRRRPEQQLTDAIGIAKASVAKARGPIQSISERRVP
jgi:hypothetical protein